MSMVRSFRIGAVLVLGVLSSGCADERAPINRVQPNALDKAFFVGAKLSDPTDNPEFFYRPTVVDVDFGASQNGLFTASYAQTLARVGWEITEDLLVARLTYERVEGTGGNGAPDQTTGQIVAAFTVQSHFDVRRSYNPQTGEELNIVEENSDDRPWYERQFMRVDWSQNLVTTAYELDTLAALKAFSDRPIEYEAATYSVEDPNSPDAPAFSPEEGYFDITNKVFARPQLIETPYGTFPACFLSADFMGGTGPVGNCNPVELKIRLSFRRVADTDYSPVDWDGQRMSMFGAFTTGTMTPTRLGYDRKYGIVDEKWRRFAGRHNIWEKSHVHDAAGERVACAADAECASHGSGSRCDVFVKACTLPYRDRKIRRVPYYYGPDSDPTLFESAQLVAADWDSALRHAVQTARYGECVREKGGAANAAARSACTEEYPPTLEGALEKVEPILAMCHNPVSEGDPEMCGERGRTARVGDLRYHMANIIDSPQVPSPWGILADASDPLTGEVVASSVNVWNNVTDLRTQQVIDSMRWYLGELSSAEVSAGVYVQPNNVVQSGASLGASARDPSVLSSEEVAARLGALDRSLMPEEPVELPAANARQLLDWASATTRDTFGSDVLGRGNANLQSRLNAARGTPLETQLMTTPYLALAGLKPATPLDATTLQAASPLRGSFWQNRSALERERQLQHAAAGRCVLEAAEPNGVLELAEKLAAKFPVVDENPATPAIDLSPAALLARNTKWADYIRKRITRGVLAHEMGHSMGLRHVFTSSFDALNYRPQYWQLRTRDKKETTYCTAPTTDGSSCIGPRWSDPITDAERDGMQMAFQQTSVMDYPGEVTQDMLDIGPYDRAAIRFLYGDMTDVWDDERVKCSVDAFGAEECSPQGGLLAGQLDTFGGIQGAYYGLVSRYDQARHYSQLDKELDLIRDCRPASVAEPAGWNSEVDGIFDPVLDGHVVNGTVCSGVPTDYVPYSDLTGVTTRDGTTRKFDAAGRVRRPYMFASDEYADIGNIAVYRHDNGADAYEVAKFLIREYEDRHVFENHRRGRTTFSLSGAFNRSYSRYQAKLKEMTKAYALLNEVYAGSGVLEQLVTAPHADGLSKPHALAASLTFDHVARVLTRPASGPHFLATPDALDNFVLRSTDQALLSNGPGGQQRPSLVVPEGTQNPGSSPSFGGRPLHNALDQSKGYYATDYQLWVGSYYEKTLAADMLADSTDRFISQSRDDFHDGRYRNVSFATLFPEGVRRLVGTALTEDSAMLGWRVAARAGRPQVQNGTAEPLRALGFRLWWPEDGPKTCWPIPGQLGCDDYAGGTAETGTAPLDSLPIDPEVGFEVQKFIVFFSLVYLPESWKRDWVDLMRIYHVGSDADPTFAAESSVSFRDPVSGELYRAHSHGREVLDGRSVERSIAGRVLEWANTLAAKAYVVSDADSVTGELTFERHADGQPVELDANYAKRLRNYKSIIEFMRLSTSQLGLAPSWRGVQ